MAIQFFLIFIGSVLGCSIALAVLARNLSEGFAVSGKNPFVYGSFSGILAALAGYLASYISANPFEVFWWLGGVFLIFGIVHILFIHRRRSYAHTFNGSKLLVAEIVFGLSIIFFIIVVFSSLQYFFKDREFLFYPLLMSCLMFFVPLLVYHSFLAAADIPVIVFPTWQYPSQPLKEPEISANERILVFAFKIAKKTGDRKKTRLVAKGPETMKLSDLFYHYINQYNREPGNTPIEYEDHSYEPHEWWFRREPKWYQLQKVYDPRISIRENGIGEKTVIICERIPAAV